MSMETAKEIWRGMAANTGQSLSTRSNLIVIGKSSSVETTLPLGSSERILPSKDWRIPKCASAIIYRIGDALFEVTQPRVTCYRVGIRMNEPKMAALLVSHGRPGFYFRVLEEGEVGAGDEIVRVTQGPETMTISDVNTLLYKPGHPADRLERALRIPALSAGWRRSFEALLERTQSTGGTSGNPGLAPAIGPPAAWTGFRPMGVAGKKRES